MPRTSVRRVGLSVALCLLPAVARPADARAQQPGTGVLPATRVHVLDSVAGSPGERTMQIFSLLGDSGAWTNAPLRARAPSILAMPPLARLWLNLGAAAPDRDGAVWQGRGVTASATGGFVARAGPLVVGIRPVAFVTQNAEYTPRPEPTDSASFRHPVLGQNIDLPYRFGDGVYAALAPGESRVALERGVASLGVSTEQQIWGPAHAYPLILSAEAGGYPRAYARLRRWEASIGRVSAEWHVGRLYSSGQVDSMARAQRRVASAITLSVSPRGLSALEIGGTRFFHMRTDGAITWSMVSMPFDGLVKESSSDAFFGGANQIASVFMRLAPSGGGVEVYGEFLRDDHNANPRDLAAEPDHASAWVLGFRRAWRSGAERMALTIERASGRFTHLLRVRAQAPIYTHTEVTEGHTHRGQPLGSIAVLGGSGLSVVLDQVGETRSRFASLEVRSLAHNQEGGTFDGHLIGQTSLAAGQRWVAGSRLLGAFVELQSGHGPRGTVSGRLGAEIR